MGSHSTQEVLMELLRDESFQLRDGDPAFRLIVHTVDNPYYTSRTKQ